MENDTRMHERTHPMFCAFTAAKLLLARPAFSLFLFLTCCFVFFQAFFPRNIYPQLQFLLRVSLLDTILIFLLILFTQYVSLLFVNICWPTIWFNCPGFIWCWLFSFLIRIMCLICLFHLFKTLVVALAGQLSWSEGHPDTPRLQVQSPGRADTRIKQWVHK